MSCYQSFPDPPTAQAAFAEGRCRRHVEIDGHVIDLVQAAAEKERQREEPAVIVPPAPASIATAILHDLDVARNVRAALAGDAPIEPPLAEPAIAAPPVECCRACGRPLIGGAP